ncbi:MAG: hypothetical protein ACK559_15585, partial [bacterium]
MAVLAGYWIGFMEHECFMHQDCSHGVGSRRLIRSSRPQEIFQPPQQGFFSVHAQLQVLGNIFFHYSHLTAPQLTSHL